MTIKEWGNIDGTAVGEQFIEKAKPIPSKTYSRRRRWRYTRTSINYYFYNES